MPNRARQINRFAACLGAAGGLRRCLVAGLLLQVVASGGALQSPEGAPSPPRLAILSPPPVILPGQPVRVRLLWSLTEPAEPDPTPGADLGEALLQWGAMTRSQAEVVWEGDIVPLQPGSLSGQITCTATLPLLPADRPRSTLVPVPPRYLANLYSPCRARRIVGSAALPPIDVTPLPPAPPGTPPFSGLLGTWSATLTADRAQVAMREPLTISLCLQGRGSATLFRPPTLSHPDFEVMRPTVERGATGDLLNVRWTVLPSRVPLDPIRLEFSTLDRMRYACHRLELAIRVQAEPPPSAGDRAPPPVLLRFHPMPESSTPAGAGALAGCLIAGLGVLAGFTLAGAARHRDLQRGPEGLRRAALKRLQQMQLTHVDELPRVYHDLRLWLDLPVGATVVDIDEALRPPYPELADELRALESCRFSAAAEATASPRRLQARLRRLSCLALAAFCLGAAAALPPEESLARVAEEAFRQRDFAEACNALTVLRQRGRESPELLLNLANAYWFTGRRVEALALYERAVRRVPRRQDCRDGLAWLRANLPAPGRVAATPWTLPVRDRLRPDEWVFLAGVLVALGCLSGGLLRWWCRPTRYALGIAAIAAFGCLWFAMAQWTGTYRVGATARLTTAVSLRAAPAAVAEALTPVLPAGTLVTPTGEQADWLLVRTATAEGWVPETGCILVW